MVGHLELAKQPPAIVERLVDMYHADDRFDRDLAARFAGVEMMRRVIGVAQLPLVATLSEKRVWLERSRQLVCGGHPREAS